MANLREYEMLFKLNAQLGSSYNSSFKSAQQAVVSMQKDIDALNKVQSNISAYEKQQISVEATRKKLETLKQQYNNIQKEIKETGEFSSTLQNKLLSKQQQIDKTSASIDTQTHKLNQLGDALREAGVDTEALRSEEAKLESQITDLKQKQEQAAESAQKYGATASNAMNTVGQAIISSGILYGLKQIYDQFTDLAVASMEYQSALTGVAKTTDLTSSELAALSAEIKDLSTDIPVVPTELLEIAEAAGQLGIAKDYILDFSEVMANLGVATNMTSDQAATDLAKFANVVKMSADDYERLGSTIVDLGNKGASTESEIVSMATRLASTGSLIGLSEAEIMAVASSLSSLGIEAEAGGSAISKLLKEFEVMVETKSPALKDFAKVAGMSAKEFSAAWGENSVEALSKFVDGLGKIDAEGGSAIATLEELDITEIRMSNAVLALASSNGILTRNLDTANRAWEENTALAKEAERRYEDTRSKLTMMQNAYSNLKVAIGDNYNPALAEMYELSTDVLGSMTGFVEQNPPVVKGITTTATALGGVIAALAAYTTVAKAATVFSAAFTVASGAALGPILAVAAGVAVLAGGLVALNEASKNEADEVRLLTAVSREQYAELQKLSSEYDRAAELYGENSKQAKQLRWQIEDLTAQYEAGKQTVEDFVSQMDAAVESSADLRESHRDAIDVIDKQEYNTMLLINKLADLASQNDQTAESQEQMKAIIDSLNESLPELSLNYDDIIGKGPDVVDSIKEVAKAQAERQRYEESYDRYVELLISEEEVSKKIKEAEEALTKEKERATEANQKYNEALAETARYGKAGPSLIATMFSDEAKEADAAKEAVKDYEAALKSANDELAEIKKSQSDIDAIFSEYSTKGKANVDGSHAAGLNYVPFDGYIAELHQGERVLTAQEARMSPGSGGFGNITIAPTYNIDGVSDTAAMRGALVETTEDLKELILDVIEDHEYNKARRAYR